MDSLRWILLLVGALFVVGVYLLSRRNNHRRVEPMLSDREIEAHPVSEEEDWEIRAVDRRSEGAETPRYDAAPTEPLADSPDEITADIQHEEPLELDESLTAQLQGLEQALRGDDPVPTERISATPSRNARAPAPTPPEEKIVAFFLVAPKGQPFAGSEIAAVFAELGLVFGDMDIFHRVSENSLHETVFSVASLVEPGTFDPDAMDAMNTPGLSLFMRLPGPNEPLQAYDDLVSTARALADRLHGELRDQTRSLVTAQTLESMRTEVAEFERRMNIPQGSA